MRFSNVLKEFITDRHYDLDKNVDFYEFTFPNKIVVFVSKIKKGIFKKRFKMWVVVDKTFTTGVFIKPNAYIKDFELHRVIQFEFRTNYEMDSMLVKLKDIHPFIVKQYI